MSSTAETALDKPTIAALRASYAASRRHYRFAAGAMSALTVALIVMCAIAGAWGSLAIVGGLFVPLWLYVGYRSIKFIGPEAVDVLIDQPDRISAILKVVTPRTHVLGVELDDGRLVPLRFRDEAALDEVRKALAAAAPKASVAPPIE